MTIKGFTYRFDKYLKAITNTLFFIRFVSPLIDNWLLSGVNSIIMAYGQTGSGKSYTMGTSKNEAGVVQNEYGVIQKTIEKIINSNRSNQYGFSFKIKLFEIYMRLNDDDDSWLHEIQSIAELNESKEKEEGQENKKNEEDEKDDEFKSEVDQIESKVEILSISLTAKLLVHTKKSY